MKRFTVISSLFLSTLLNFSSAQASTNISSNLIKDTHWDQKGSPYLIQGQIAVPKGTTLRIEPNVQVIFQGTSILEVNGTLKVMGAPAAPQVFNMTDRTLQKH